MSYFYFYNFVCKNVKPEIYVLWNSARPLIIDNVVEDHRNNLTLGDVNEIERKILALHKLDDNAQSFRYPISTEGKPTLNISHSVSINTLKRDIEWIYNKFESFRITKY